MPRWRLSRLKSSHILSFPGGNSAYPITQFQPIRISVLESIVSYIVYY